MGVKVRAQCQVWFDSLLPRDAMSINPCFEFTGALFDGDGFCNSVATMLDSLIGSTGQITVKTYDLEGTKPVFPNGQKTIQTGASPASTVPRELALCLSYYAGVNQPRRRGRLYIPLQWLSTRTTDVRPLASQRDLLVAWGDSISALGGADVDWILWSEASNSAHKVTNVYVDDEWDVMRSRGLRPTTRSSDTVSG